MSPVELPYMSLWARSEAESVPDTFSSWDKCMDKTYCKWPVIVGIIVGGVILLSVIACIVNCLCCGIRCCTGCCGCCCPSPRPKRTKYADDPYHHQPPPMPQMPQMPPPNNEYQGGYQGGYQAPQAPPTYRGAQVARFDTPSSPGASKMNDDALPAMPVWDNAVTRKVEDTDPHSDSVEMEPLNTMTRPPHRTPSAPRANGAGYMGPPPVRTMQNDYYPDSPGYDDPNPYDYHSHGPGHSPASPYDQPYRDNSPGGFHAMSPPNAYSPQPQAHPQYPIGVAVSPTTDMNRPIPFRQPSPGFRQPSPGFRQPSPGFRQPSPGFSQPPSYRGMSPSIPSSPPPPFSAVPIHEVSEPGRPPSLLQSGRKPVPNSYRDV
ncbi:hypothetical protein BDW59DRAFT_58022 [Aspergillus cavernicola]|uniref:Uncharacterized protein n=1 Tax=Aspergillus cavernicola TaxID=176166 RepID=A0ABR4IHB9_9EURO